MSIPKTQLSVTGEQLDDQVARASAGVPIVATAFETSSLETALMDKDEYLFMRDGTLYKITGEALGVGVLGGALVPVRLLTQQVFGAADAGVTFSGSAILVKSGTPSTSVVAVYFLIPAGTPTSAELLKAEMRCVANASDTGPRELVIDSRLAINHHTTITPTLPFTGAERPSAWAATTVETKDWDVTLSPTQTAVRLDVTDIVKEAMDFTSSGDTWYDDGLRLLAIRFRYRSGDASSAFSGVGLASARLVLLPN